MRSLFAALFLLLPLPAAAADPLIPPDKASGLMKLPDGFRASLVAGEPTLVKPIAMTTDARGRLWVVESNSYPKWITDGSPGKDRILIFEPKKDGTYTRTVFLDNGRNISGIAVGMGGVWLAAVPEVLFIPVKEGEDKPSGPAKVLLDGWSLTSRHNVFSALTWGPDGWLYGCNGILAQAHVGKPGTPKEKRVPVDCGVWRLHPTKEKFEMFAWGTTNPWGLDFDDHGEMFITNCVIKHIFHVVPGAHFRRMFGADLNPNVYSLIESCADHIHWGGGDWTSSRGGKGAHSDAGGGHAHAGAMVYLADSWPAKYRNQVFMCNIHGNRVNMDLLSRKGSGYVASRGIDFLMAHDPWFRGLAMLQSPDGGAYLSDWHDTGECHNYDKVQPCGRVFKIDYGTPKHSAPDLHKASDAELVKMQFHANDWWVRQARVVLQERAAAGKLGEGTRKSLLAMLEERPEATRKLRALWALYAINGIDEKTLAGLLDNSHETVRGWAVRLLVDQEPPSDKVIEKLARLAESEKSAAVRLALASALQRLPLEKRWELGGALAAHAEDGEDANLPLMIWYGIEAAIPADPGRAAELIKKCKIPVIRQYVARRLAGLVD